MPSKTKPVLAPIQVSVILFDQFSNHCLANCVEPLRAANTISAKKLFDWQYLTLNGNSVSSSSGLPIVPVGTLKDARNGSIVYIVSSYNYRAHNTPRLRVALNQLAARASLICGFDTGAWLMAASGLLKNREATVHWDVLDRFEETFDQVTIRKARFIWDQDRATCAGGMAAFDLSLALIGFHFGEPIKLDVENLFIKDRRDLEVKDRAAGSQKSLVDQATVIMQENLELVLPISTIAERLNTYPKHLQRQFQMTVGENPDQVYRHLRLSLVRKLLEDTELPIAEVSLRAGYENVSAMGRAFKRRFGTSPKKYRSLRVAKPRSIQILR